MRRLLKTLLLLVVFSMGCVFAAVPDSMNFQGKLTDLSGVAIEGSYSVTFSIYNVPSGGSSLWSETHGSVIIDHGLFDVILGSVTSLTLDFSVPYWVEISVAGETLTPRLPLTSSPYSFRAAIADSVSGGGGTVQNDVDVPLTLTGDFTIISGETEVHGALDDLDAAIATNQTDIADNATDIAAHNAADGDLSSSNELITAFTWTDASDQLTITEAGTPRTVMIDNEADDLSDNMINDLGNVNAAPSSGQILGWNGSQWIAVDDATGAASTDDQNLSFSGAASPYTLDIEDGTDVTFASGSGITLSRSVNQLTITNAAPDQTVSIGSGSGISVGGSYPNFTVTNTAPDQTVTIGSGTGISVTGGYPNFTVTNSAPWTDVSNSYIQNQNASAQSADYWIDGSGRIDGSIAIGGASVAGNIKINVYENTDGWTMLNLRDDDSGVSTGYGRNFIRQRGSSLNIEAWEGNIEFLTTSSSTERMRITNAGNVGIGTTAPSTQLHTTGGVRFTGAGTPGAGRVLTSDASGNATWQVPSGGSDGDWTISGVDQYSAVSGNVGIGTTTPSTKLHVLYDADTYGQMGGTNFGVRGQDGTSYGLLGCNGYAGIFNGQVVPNTDDSHTLGTSVFRWNNGYFTNLTLGGVTISSWPSGGTYTAGNDLDLSGTTFNIEPVLDYVTLVNFNSGAYITRGNTTNLGYQPDGANPGIIIEDFSAETGGFFANGNIAVIWSPGDPDLLRVYDEDDFPSPSAPDFKIDGSGNPCPGADAAHDLGTSSYSWRNLYIDGGIYIDGSSGTSGYVLKTDGAGSIYWDVDATGAGGSVSGSGTTNYLPLWTGASTLGDSRLNQVNTNTTCFYGTYSAAPAVLSVYPYNTNQDWAVFGSSLYGSEVDGSAWDYWTVGGGGIMGVNETDGQYHAGIFGINWPNPPSTITAAITGINQVQNYYGALSYYGSDALWYAGFFDGEVNITSNESTRNTLNVSGAVASPQAIGRFYNNYGTSSDAYAVYGYSRTADYWGIAGRFEGGWYGVDGRVYPTGSSFYYGTRGYVSGGSGTNYGIYGYANGTGTNYGVYGSASGGTNYAGYFSGNVRINSGIHDGASYGTAGQVLTTDGSNIYWSTVSGGSGQWTVSGSDIYASVNSNVYVRGSADIGEYMYINQTATPRFGLEVYDGTYTDGTGYTYSTAIACIAGRSYDGDAYNFGVAGWTYTDDNRSGGAFGGKHSSATGPWGCLCYQNSGGTEYGAYWTSSGSGAGRRRPSPDYNDGEAHINIGTGGWGDLFGADIHGNIYGAYIEGGRYALYTHGNNFTDGLNVQLIERPGDDPIIGYTTISNDVTVIASGRASLVSGTANVRFDVNFAEIISSEEPVIVNVTPIVGCNPLYLASSDEKGFTVIESDGGYSNGSFNWIAIGIREGYENGMDLPAEVVAADYNDKITRGLHNDADTQTDGEGLYFETGELVVGKHVSTFPDSKLTELKREFSENPSNRTFEEWDEAFTALGESEMPVSRQAFDEMTRSTEVSEVLFDVNGNQIPEEWIADLETEGVPMFTYNQMMARRKQALIDNEKARRQSVEAAKLEEDPESMMPVDSRPSVVAKHINALTGDIVYERRGGGYYDANGKELSVSEVVTFESTIEPNEQLKDNNNKASTSKNDDREPNRNNQ